MDGQNVNIDLNAGLDTQSNDMLVSVNSPKFLHNRQKMQGRYMPNSVRYEHDGWAVDNDVYEFEKVDVTIETSPKQYLVSRETVSSDVPLYKFFVKDEAGNIIGTFKYTPKSNNITNDQMTIHVSDSLTAVVKYNRVTNKWELVSGNGCRLEATQDNQYRYTLTVINTAKTFQNQTYIFTKGTDIEINGKPFELVSQNTTGSEYGNEGVTISTNTSGVTAVKVNGVDYKNASSRGGTVGVKDSIELSFVPTEKKFVTHFSGIGSSEPLKLMNFEAHDKVIDNYITLSLSGEEYNSSTRAWNDCEETALAYDSSSGHKMRLKLDVAIPVWGGISFLKGMRRNTTGASRITTPADVVSDCGGKLQLHPGKISGGYLHRYSTTVLSANITVWQQCKDITKDFTLSPISPMQLHVKYSYYKIEPAATFTECGKEFYDEYVKTHSEEYYTTTEEEVSMGSDNGYTNTHYWYKKFVPTKVTGNATIEEFDKWAWTCADIETLMSFDGIHKLFSWTSETQKVARKDTGSSLGIGVDYGIENLGKLVSGACKWSADSSWNDYDTTSGTELYSDESSFDDNSFYHTDVYPKEGTTAWIMEDAVDDKFVRRNDKAISFWACLSSGEIQGYHKYEDGSGKSITPRFKNGILAFCYKGVFSKYLSLKNPVVNTRKQSAEFTYDDFELTDATTEASSNSYDVSSMFDLEVGNIRFSSGQNCITLNVVKKGTEPEYIFYCVKDSTSSSSDDKKTPKRWWFEVDDIKDRYCPGHIYNGSIDLAGSASGNMKAVAILNTYQGSSASNTVSFNLDAISANEKNYISNVTSQKGQLAVLQNFDTPEVDKYCAMLDTVEFVDSTPTVVTSLNTSTGEITATMGQSVTMVASSVDPDIKDFPVKILIYTAGDGVSDMGIVAPMSAAGVTGKSTFDTTYSVDKDTVKAKIDIVAYLTVKLGTPYAIKKGSTAVSAFYKNGICYAVAPRTDDPTKGLYLGYSFSKGKAYLSFTADAANLGSYELKQSEFTIAGKSTEKTVTFNTYEKKVVTGVTIDTTYEVSSAIDKATINTTYVTIVVGGKTYTVPVSAFTNTTQKPYLKYLYTRIDDADSNNIYLGKQYTDEEFQFLKQQWNTTVDVENFWWIDSNHILVLTKKEIQLLRKNPEELDDWAADKWELEKSYEKFEYITNKVMNYFVSNVYGTTAAMDGAVFITMEQRGTDSFLINLYNPLNGMSKVQKEVYVNKVEIGEELNANKQTLNTYSTIVIDNMLTQAKFTATIVDTKVFIGIHYDNNFNQWTIVADRDLSSIVIVQGYGFVGVDGLLTGGEIPKTYFATGEEGYLGFNSKVEPISVLGTAKDEDKQYLTDLGQLSELTERVVGTDSQQWYITKVLADIVSHIKVSVANGVVTFTPEYIPLSNTYSVNYASGSFGATVLGDYNPQTTGLMEFIRGAKADGLDKFLSLALSPQVCYFNTKISTLTYLQQTLGQAAYVHYNSTSIHQSQDTTSQNTASSAAAQVNPESTAVKSSDITADSIAFDFQSVRQKVKAADNIYENLLTLVGSAISAVNGVATEKLKVNSTVNKTTTSDVGKAFGTYFMSNLQSAAVSEFTAMDMNPKLNAEVSAVKTLDMFFSTSAEQEISAGSGWVNHNFVAQCTSQSVTNVQTEGRQQKFFLLITAITMIPIYAVYKGLEVTEQGLAKTTDSTSGGLFVMGGMAAGTNAAEVATHYASLGAWAVAKAALEATKTVIELLPDILKGLGGDKLQTAVTSFITKHNIDIEGCHKYGSKSESFMYPCWKCQGNVYTDELVDVGIQNKKWYVDMQAYDDVHEKKGTDKADFTTSDPSDSIKNKLKGDVDYFIASVRGSSTEKPLPVKMACIEGVKSFLPETLYKNENIGESEPVFSTHPFQDYIIDENWQLSRTASVGMTTWISCKDTKLIDGDASNMVITDEFCGVAAPYTAIEIKRGIEMKYLRPFALTPKVLSLNCTGYNCLYDERMYHAFDGYGYRLVNWTGESGMAKGTRVWQYSFLVNDRFKRSNKMPLNEFFGNFKSDPVLALPGTAEDKVFSLVTMPEEAKGLTAGTIGEDKDKWRYSLPVFTEYVSTLPAVVKTISSYNLSVVDGITTLTTENHDLQSAYKAPTSVDFSIGEDKYRYTNEYICSLQNNDSTSGVTIVEHLCPCIGLTYLGATPTEALFYSQNNRQYYKYSGGRSVQLVDMMERFRNIISGKYDFINQEIVVPAIATFKRLDDNVEDDADETDNVIVLRLNGQEVKGEICPPLKTIFKTKEGEDIHSWFRVLSLPTGIVFQGPNRCIVNRFIINDYMLEDIKANYGKWKRVPKEYYHPFRTYKKEFETVKEFIGEEVEVRGWTHNPFLLVTAPLGVNEETDCLFEWNITFCWTNEMDMLYNKNEYAVVNVMAETMTPGGKVVAARPVHIYLVKELFTRTGNYGYYSFRYQSNCGAGNRERLHLWSDQYIAISDLSLTYKTVTQKRNDILTQQVDISRLVEV